MSDVGIELIDAAIARGATLTTRVLGLPNWNAGVIEAYLVFPNGWVVGAYGENQEHALLELARVLAAESPG